MLILCCAGIVFLKLFTEALDVREADSSDWFRFFFSWLVVVCFV